MTAALNFISIITHDLYAWSTDLQKKGYTSVATGMFLQPVDLGFAFISRLHASVRLRKTEIFMSKA